MEYSKSTQKVLSFVKKVKNHTRKTPVPIQKIPLEEQNAKRHTQITHPSYDDSYQNWILFLAYELSNKKLLKKSKSNPSSIESMSDLEYQQNQEQQYFQKQNNSAADERELEAALNATRYLRNGEEVRYIEYEPGKYCCVTPTEYKRFLCNMADDFYNQVLSKLDHLRNEKQLDFLLDLEKWADDSSTDKIFDIDYWW